MFSMHDFPRKVFVKGGNFREDTTSNHENDTKNTITGDSARNFYESVVKESSAAAPKPVRKQNKITISSVPKHQTSKTFAPKDVWKLAQNNDFIALASLLSDNKNLEIDCKDPFGWTPLMCASCSGAKECVEILRKYKADPNICDKSGNTAITLARRNGFFHIVNILENENDNVAKNKKTKKKAMEKIYCKTCNSVFHTNLKDHECSTLHLFNTNSGKTKTFYGIPDSNRGFQMLLKNGWDREKGLGLNECGIRFPIKAQRKNDRVGFGGVIPKIKTKSNDLNMESRYRTQRSWKNFERNFKLEFL